MPEPGHHRPARAALLLVTTALSRLLAQHLFDVSTSDALTLAAAPAPLIAAALAACYGPARRAAGVEPLAALRAE